MIHKHRVHHTTTICYRGTVAAVITEDRRAHGGVCFVDRCKCGAKRETNSTGGHIERGRWVEDEREEVTP